MRRSLQLCDEEQPFFPSPEGCKLPEEVVLEVLSYLDCFQLCRLSAVARAWRRLSSDSILWKRLCAKKYASTLCLGSETLLRQLSSTDWKTNFRTLKGERHLQDLSGENHSIVLCESGELLVWFRESPRVCVEGESACVKWTWVSSGENHYAAISREGKLFTWAWGECGQLGHGDAVSEAEPRVVSALESERVVCVACGGAHTAAVTECGDVWSWGSGRYGQLGRLGLLHDSAVPERVMCPRLGTAWHVGKICSASAGTSHTLALSDTGHVYGWGSGGLGKCGNGTSRNTPNPKSLVGLDGVHVVLISAGCEHSAVVDDEGNLYTFGFGWNGELGHGVCDHLAVPTRVRYFDTVRVRTVSCGMAYTLAVDMEGRTYAWGSKATGRLGLELAQDVEALRTSRGSWRALDDRVVPPTSPRGLLRSGAVPDLEAFTDRRSVAPRVEWNPTFHEVVAPEFSARDGFGCVSTPALVSELAGVRVATVSAGRSVSVAVSAGGSVYTWGRGVYAPHVCAFRDVYYTPLPQKLQVEQPVLGLTCI